MRVPKHQPPAISKSRGNLPPRGSLIHCVGVCGMGMAPLALALREAGWRVSGEDGHWPTEVTQWLRLAGIERLDSNALPEDTALVVYSSAVGADHVSREQATKRDLPVLRRGEALAALVRNRPLVAIVGSHGKTTTTAMLVTAMRASGATFDYIAGGLFADDETPPAQWWGEGMVVAEIDESDGTIGSFTPDISLCVNLDWDHCDRYATPAELSVAFTAFAKRTKQSFLFNQDCQMSRDVFGELKLAASVVSFGVGGDFNLLDVGSGPNVRQTLRLGGRFGAAETSLSAWGQFNAVNATGALAATALIQKGILDLSRTGLESFVGVRRRQTVLWSRGGSTVVEDYAHHPSEIEALLVALRSHNPRRLRVVFQPHRYTRTAQFKGEFAQVLKLADEVILLPVYAASEQPVPGGRVEDLMDSMHALSGGPLVRLVDNQFMAAVEMAAGLESGDLLAFVGAGDIDQVARRVVALLRKRPVAAFDGVGRLEESVEGLLSPETALLFNEPLGSKTTMRVGGAAAVYVEPASTADLQTLIRAARDANLPVYLLGRGSNLIVPDDGVHGLVVRLNHAHWRRLVCLGPGRYWVGAGLRLRELSSAACQMGESGFEFLEGIPGTVGGALRMNAGAMDGWMHDLVNEIHSLDHAGNLRVVPRAELHVEYRRCVELEHAIAIGAVLRTQGRADSGAIRECISGLQAQRQVSQPREPSAGCIFKNPPGESAGCLIDELGLKGLRIGGAEVSAVHANFIVNRGEATSADVIALVRRVREEVRARRDIELEPEALLYGRDWTEVLR